MKKGCWKKVTEGKRKKKRANTIWEEMVTGNYRENKKKRYLEECD